MKPKRTKTETLPAVGSSALFGQVASEIVTALENPRVYRWTTWDSWAGSQIHHERGMSKEEAVIEVLKRYWPNYIIIWK